MEFSYQELTFSQLFSSKVKDLYFYWDKKRGSRPYPSLADIELEDIPDVEPYLMFAQLYYSPFKIRYNYIGHQSTHFYKRDLTGQWLHEIFEGDMLRHFEVPHRLALTHPEPMLGIENWPGSSHTFEWGIFPLSDNGITITHNLVIEDYSHLDRAQLPDFPYRKLNRFGFDKLSEAPANNVKDKSPSH
jgi:hypothetical protein